MTDWEIARKFTDKELLDFMKSFLKENDQIPPHVTMAAEFNCCVNAIAERLKRLEKKGILKRNSVNKIMFSRR